MKKLILLILFLSLSRAAYSQIEPCWDCSRSGLSGFEYYQTSGEYNLGSAVGGISYRAVESSDGKYKLLSGYMPICVMPYTNIGSGDTVCSGETASFNGAGYLTDSFTWFVNGENINLNSDTYIPSRRYTRSKEGYTEKIVFKASKGKYSAESDTAYYKENPMPWVDASTIPPSLCIGQKSAFEIKEMVFGEISSIVWTKSTGLTFADNNKQEKANISLTEDTDFEAVISTKDGCDTTISFSIKVNKPSCELDIKSPEPINPAEVSKNEPISIPIRIHKASGFGGCVPDSAAAYLQIRASMFLPNTSSEKAKISYEYRNYKETNLITVKGKVKESLASGDYVLELEGWPLLGDVESTPIIFDSLRWFSTKYPAELIDTKIYSNGNLTILCCGNKQVKRLIEKVGAAAIKKISPMPIAEGKIKIDIESFVKEQQNIVLNIYNSLGEKVGLIYEGTLSSGISSMEVNLPEAIRSGMYQVVINGTNSAYPIFITR